MYIDPSSVCNFSCAFCFQANPLFKKETRIGKMSMDTFENIVDQLGDFEEKIKMVHLHGFGEPLLNKYFIDMVKCIKNANVCDRVATTSNASLLSKTLSEKIVDSKLDQIHFSIYGLNDGNYKTFSNRHVSFQDIVENIKYLHSIKSNSGGGIRENMFDIYAQAKAQKDYASADSLREELKNMGVEIMDTSQGTNWEYVG